MSYVTDGEWEARDHDRHGDPRDSVWARVREGYDVCVAIPPLGTLIREHRANMRLMAASKALAALAVAYEQWEARLIMSNEAWDGGLAEFPRLTQELYDHLLTLQAERNRIIGALREQGVVDPAVPVDAEVA